MLWTTAEFKDVAAALQSIATSVSLIVGGAWVYQRYIRQQERYPHIEISADIALIGEQDNFWIVELICFLENKGKVQHRLEKFEFDINGLRASDPVNISEEFGGQINFLHYILKASFLPRRFKFFFVDPGVKAKYSYVARIPKDMTFVMFHCWFNYPDGRNFGHAAERTVHMPTLAKKKVAREISD